MESYLLGWVIMKDSPNADAAAEFMRYSMSATNSQMIPDVAVNLSSRADTTPPAMLADAWDLYTNATSLYLPYDGINAYHSEYYKTVFLKNHDAAWLGKISPEDFALKMKEDTIAYWKDK